MNELSISPRRVFRTLAALIAMLVTANLIYLLYFRDYLGNGWLWGFGPLFHMDLESNIPAYFSSALLLCCALLLTAIAMIRRTQNHPSFVRWASLAAIFFYISMDESAEIHELVSTYLHDTFDTGGIFYFAWVIVAIPVIAVLGAVYFRFILALPPRSTRLFILSALLYVGGALGMELIAGWWVDRFTSENRPYVFMSTIEETLEMIGTATFIYALLDYIRTEFGSVHVSFGRRGSA